MHINKKTMITIEMEKAREASMTIDDMLHQFANENEEQIMMCVTTNNTLSKIGVASSIDKTFSRMEKESNKTSNQKLLDKTKEVIISHILQKR